MANKTRTDIKVDSREINKIFFCFWFGSFKQEMQTYISLAFFYKIKYEIV